MFVRWHTRLAAWARDLRQDERGASAVEYALMLALIAVVIVAAVQLLGTSTSSTFDTMGDCLASACP
jgi:pilus assembly protein Flp/PilA